MCETMASVTCLMMFMIVLLPLQKMRATRQRSPGNVSISDKREREGEREGETDGNSNDYENVDQVVAARRERETERVNERE